MLLRQHLATVVMAQTGPEDHFAGLERALTARGISSDRLFAAQPVPPFTRDTRVVVVANAETCLSRFVIRQARRVGGTSVMVMDGLAEWRNTFVNPIASERFLRPAPVDIIACAGEIDRRILIAMGNNAVATGLPRLQAIASAQGARAKRRTGGARRIMIATAKTPAFNPEEQTRLVIALGNLGHAADMLGVEVVWRLTDALASKLNVKRDESPLPESFARVSAVITTPSTLMIESMICGLPTALLHPHAAPLWQPSLWVHGHPDAACGDQYCGRMTSLDSVARDSLQAIAIEAAKRSTRVPSPQDLIERILSTQDTQLRLQEGILNDLHSPFEQAPDRLADLIARQLSDPVRSASAARFQDNAVIVVPAGARVMQTTPSLGVPDLSAGLHLQPAPTTQLPHVALTAGSSPRAVIVVGCAEPIGNASTTWAAQFAREFSQHELGYEVWVLIVLSAGTACQSVQHLSPTENRTCVCVLDPYSDNVSNLDRVIRAIECLTPSIVLPVNLDLFHAAAIQVRARAAASERNVRIVGVACCSEPRHEELLRTYNVWDAAIGIGDVAMNRLSADPVFFGRPMISIGAVSDAGSPPADAVLPSKSDVRRVATLFDAFKQTRIQARPTTLGLHLLHTGHRRVQWADEPALVRQWIDARLREAGYCRIAHGRPVTGCDCVVLDSCDEPEQIKLRQHCTAMGMEVVFAPTLIAPETSDFSDPGEMNCGPLVIAALERAVKQGSRRIVLYGSGAHLHRYAGA
ncbi:MAG: hypothetical protein H7210_06540, partial [Pyrinomonadaceae bacterium]|nr:hypothetical protein [Phycisphaerales bacterium]